MQRVGRSFRESKTCKLFRHWHLQQQQSSCPCHARSLARSRTIHHHHHKISPSARAAAAASETVCCVVAGVLQTAGECRLFTLVGGGRRRTAARWLLSRGVARTDGDGGRMTASLPAREQDSFFLPRIGITSIHDAFYAPFCVSNGHERFSRNAWWWVVIMVHG